MLRDVKLDIFYPYSPERVWQAITNRRVLAQWLMDNDFEPRVGHKFRFEPQPHQGINEVIHCEVIELDEPRSLSYTWRGSFAGKPTIVTWRLVPVEGGTQVQLEHKDFERNAIAWDTFQRTTALNQSKTRQYNSAQEVFLQMGMREPIESKMLLSRGHGRVEQIDSVTLNFDLDGGWHDALNHKLPTLLNDIAKLTSCTTSLVNRK